MQVQYRDNSGREQRLLEQPALELWPRVALEIGARELGVRVFGERLGLAGALADRQGLTLRHFVELILCLLVKKQPAVLL